MTESGDPLAQFIAECERRFRPEESRSFWDCTEAFAELAGSGFVVEHVNRELARCKREPGYLGSWMRDEMLLHRGRFVVTVILQRAPRRFLHCLPRYAIYAPLQPEPIEYDRYDLPADHRSEVFDPTVRLAPGGSHRLEAGEMLRLDSDRHVYDLRHSEPMLFLALLSSPVRTQEWLFSRDTLQALQVNDADLSFTQLRVAADMLGKFAHQASLPALQRLTRHPHHAVRWAAVQNLGRLSRGEAVKALQAASEDPHPHVQRAARKTLERILPGS